MPRQFGGYEPDQLDCQNISLALSVEFGVMPEIATSYTADQVIVVVRCRPLAQYPDGTVVVQALDKIPLKHHKSLYVAHYSALLDCWHQLDRGVLAASARPIERGWNGRPHTPRRRT